MSDTFERFAPFVRDFIYRNGWSELRDIQTESAKVIFDSRDNLLLTTPTASGKTEAAFFPIITDIWENPPESFGVLYIAPLKSLINDQFARMEDMIRESGIPVYHFHGDVAQSHKAKAIKNPAGISGTLPARVQALDADMLESLRVARNPHRRRSPGFDTEHQGLVGIISAHLPVPYLRECIFEPERDVPRKEFMQRGGDSPGMIGRGGKDG